MTKLTNMIRESLALEVLRHRFSDEIEKFVADRVSFAGDVYEDVYRKADREKMAALPDGWLPIAMAISAQFGDLSSSYENVSFGGGVHGTLHKLRKQSGKRNEIINLRVLEKHRSGCAKRYANDHRLSVRYQALKGAGKDLLARIEAAERQIDAALGSVTTLPGLLKAWPEIEPFTKRYFTQPAKLPAIPVSALNEMFKLPVKQAA